ncbi:hypothetical protein NDU88_002086 [Pleurodeles waltl]|uniref:Uncharacterized protein n=1 Tax=Pleurodeles waltl TaxID=8319 RepID=A0AAV7V9J4_PLEWA|nr:hypothetical protein NDU88_002086 [Pleurodeles waltl]
MGGAGGREPRVLHRRTGPRKVKEGDPEMPENMGALLEIGQGLPACQAGWPRSEGPEELRTGSEAGAGSPLGEPRRHTGSGGGATSLAPGPDEVGSLSAELGRRSLVALAHPLSGGEWHEA